MKNLMGKAKCCVQSQCFSVVSPPAVALIENVIDSSRPKSLHAKFSLLFLCQDLKDF